MTPNGSEVRLRILAATARCMTRWSVSKTTMADVAVEAGISRATLYRHFSTRDDLLAGLVEHEFTVFFGDLAAFIDGSPDLEQLLVDGLIQANRALEGHELYQRVMATEPHLVLPHLMVASAGIRSLIIDYLRPWLLDRAGGRPPAEPADVEAVLDYLSRMVLSFIESPGGWDFGDRSAVTHLVRSRFIGAVDRVMSGGTH